MSKALTKAELTLAAELLELASDQFSNHGCNDHPVPNTPENREVVAASEADSYGDEEAVEFHTDDAGRLLARDDLLMSHLSERLKEAAEEAKQ